MKYQPLSFPKNFVWGVAAAAPQIEGAAFVDGKGASVWDAYARLPGKILNGDTLDVACDHYHRYEEDFALMAKMGVKNYRLSLAWPRIYPKGRGEVNPKGLDFYNRLIDSMLENGITPWVTLFHWDLPQALEEEGGWRVRSTPQAFGVYSDTVVKALRDRVKRWITINEMHCFGKWAYGGFDSKAPGVNEGAGVANQTSHMALLAHGEGVRAVREHGGRGATVGFSDNAQLAVPLTETAEDIEAARQFFIERQEQSSGPIFVGGYSTAFLRRAGKDRPKVQKGDFDLISAPLDFVGLNIYTADYVRAGKRGKYEKVDFTPQFPMADAKWIKFVPQSLYWGARFTAEEHKPKAIYFTENGQGWHDAAPTNGEVNDLHRREYTRSYLGEVRRAIADGIPIRGYFHWSFMDNFEWAMGYLDCFGLVHVDYATQKRTPKLSAKWYAQVMKENRLV